MISIVAPAAIRNIRQVPAVCSTAPESLVRMVGMTQRMYSAMANARRRRLRPSSGVAARPPPSSSAVAAAASRNIRLGPSSSPKPPSSPPMMGGMTLII